MPDKAEQDNRDTPAQGLHGEMERRGPRLFSRFLELTTTYLYEGIHTPQTCLLSPPGRSHHLGPLSTIEPLWELKRDWKLNDCC